MVKIKPRPINYLKPFVVLIHVGLQTPYDPLLWHLVYEYGPEDEYMAALGDIMGYFPDDVEEAAAGHPPLFTARLQALSLADNPQVVRDICHVCRFSYAIGVDGPGVPRWNIYRGIRGENLVPCFHWDYLRDDPPPGYTWWGSP